MIDYQWVKFRQGVFFPFEGYQHGEWVLAAIDSGLPDGGVSLLGLEYSLERSAVEEWGDIIPRPEPESS